MTHVFVITYTIVVTYAFVRYMERKFNVANDIARDLNEL